LLFYVVRHKTNFSLNCYLTRKLHLSLFHFLRPTQSGPWLEHVHGRPQGGETGICPPLEIGPRNNFLENVKSAAQFRLIDLILAMTVHLPVRHSHCTRASFTVLVSCSRELAVHFCLVHGMAELGNGFFCCWSLLRNNTMVHFKLG